MSIEDYLITKDPYRSTSLRPAWPHPLQLQHAAELQTRLAPLSDDISTILRGHGLPEDTLFLPYHATKADYPGGDQQVNLLYVRLRRDDEMPPRLEPVQGDLVKFLLEKGIDDVHVEIVNLDLCFSPSLFPLHPQAPIVIGFDRIKSHLVDILQQTLSSSWRLLCPFDVGSTEKEARPTLVVMVEPCTPGDWYNLSVSLKTTMRKAMEDQGDQDFEVEFLPGDLSYLSGGVSFENRIKTGETPAMGWSVGIRGDEGAGTFGGYTTLSQGGKVVKGVLTNYHVIRPSLNDQNSAILQRLDQHGRLGETVIQIESLAQPDRNATLADLDAEVGGIHARIQLYDDRIKERELMEARVPPSLLEMKNVNNQALPPLVEKRKIFEPKPHLLGEVMVTSGKAILGKKISDWAFIKLDGTASHYFKPNKMFAVPEEHQPRRYDPNLGRPLPEGSPLTEFGTLERGGYYVKLGRSTGVTAGICHGALACCHWTGSNRLRFDHNGRKTELSESVTEEFIIMSKTTDQAEYRQSSFAEKGDSGAFVVDIEGKICGLLYGATYGHYGPPGKTHFYANAGLSMNVPDLINSVKLRTVPRADNRKPKGPPSELGLPGY